MNDAGCLAAGAAFGSCRHGENLQISKTNISNDNLLLSKHSHQRYINPLPGDKREKMICQTGKKEFLRIKRNMIEQKCEITWKVLIGVST